MSEPRPALAEPDEHDAWLRQALLHAPDASAAPPNALRDSILAEARSAVQPRRRSAARPSLLDHAAAFWSWLARPPVAAGFASVMAATLIGLMWWDRPMDEGIAPPLPSRADKADAARPPPAAAATIAADAQSSQPPALSAPAAPPAQDATAEKRSIARAPATMSPGVADEKERKLQAPLGATLAAPAASPFPVDKPSGNAAARRDPTVAAERVKKAESADAANTASLKAAPTEANAATTPTGPAQRTEPATADMKDGAAAGALAKAVPAPAAAPAPALAQRQRAAPVPRDAADALDARTPVAPQAFATTPAPIREAPPIGASATPSPQAAPASVRDSSANPATRPMSALIASLAREPQRWTRSATGSGSAPLDAATPAWLADVEAMAAGHWQTASAHPSLLDGAVSVDASTLRLSRDDRVAAVVRVEDGGVFFELRPGAAWLASLPAEAVARLRAGLPPPVSR